MQKRDSGDHCTRASSGRPSLCDVDVPSEDQPSSQVLRSNNIDAPPTRELQRQGHISYDAKEWTGRNHKYKQEVVRYGNFALALEAEVNKLEQQFEAESNEFRFLCEQVEAARQEYENLEAAYKQEQREKEDAERALVMARRRRDSQQKKREALKKDVRELMKNLCKTQEEAERKYIRYLEAWSEKQRVLQDTQRIEAERQALEKTSEGGLREVQKLEESIMGIRFDFQQDWSDAKEIDVTGLLRVTKSRPGEENWFAARTRAMPKTKIPRWTKTMSPP
ncbi:hypothetical protein TGME49_225300 [Toxoplasma gondii ME49]|uniref:Moesin protein, putative n=11 Tax=Toxoplasma gondii TaxID=5811 RepID=A0A125YJN8_TOXGV|nr:hypothetical protein TGME49_225300 [Toxoplasma gondii ME49]EPR62162.1 hypothetical protein TGGT1_225300 [Toxoplasma gondii GT1]ESS32555.1 hypothetical protein TGVEG_225300 [Toxoplasma gondii VEG]KAF4640575.1 hypothetical protein TGRH88_045010 [Toxoplasma gondii]KFG42883.1 hypothetical protein TGP89_225300 [Toxoplasma gondii p89]KFG45504.1 hypothetical protein TGDOM2_225300 [Toxoplasma gondii GAB2-2007-GAL-DOM2]KFG60803.1 hypothetical protein TGRUB_225300 [Toxoplasma gondii RUB]KFH13337.1 |eukprot:XP_018635990.1 hypothetical protein TGME49_225300 [Toxoplasma gondii ME49]